MGATFCNLYYHCEQTQIPEKYMPKSSRILSGLGDWTLLLTPDEPESRITRIARNLSGDVLVFSVFDDDYYTLLLYRDGKKAASLGSSGSSKLPVLAGILPEDPDALKKFRSMKNCASMDESISLLEETFGLPFYALYEDDSIQPVPKSEKTWNTVETRRKALLSRPNRFRTVDLPRDKWPRSIQNMLESNRILDENGYLPGAIPLWNGAAVSRYHRTPSFICYKANTYHEENGRKFYRCDKLIRLDFHRRCVTDIPLSFEILNPVTVNREGQVVCETPDQRELVFVDDHRTVQWAFRPELTDPHERIQCVLAQADWIVAYRNYAFLSKSRTAVWRISADNGAVQKERLLPENEMPYGFRWLPDMNCFTYYLPEPVNEMVFLDTDLNEIRRLRPEGKKRRYDLGFYSGNFCFINDWQDGHDVLVRLDLDSAETTVISLEMPVALGREVFSGNLFHGFTEARGGTLVFLDADGMLVSRHRIPHLTGIWEEDGQIYGSTMYMEDNDSFRVFLFEVIDH